MVGIIIAAALAVFVCVILFRTLRFKPAETDRGECESVEFDKERAIASLAELVKCRTVSNDDPALEDDEEFEKLIGLLSELYPNVIRTCPMQRFDGRALLFTWKGMEAGKPTVLMAHYDVVPVEEENWSFPPFGAEIHDGCMWGRGTLDTKASFNAIFSAAENLIGRGFVPQNDIYFAFSGCEETAGVGAVRIVEHFQKLGLEPELVLDEGGAVVSEVFPGVKSSCGLIGIAEKGMMDLQFTMNTGGGHASAPAPHTPVGSLSSACVKLEGKPFKAHFTKPVREMFDTLGRHSSFLYRMIFANMWLFGGVLDLLCKKQGGELNALIRTTVAFTQMSGSKAPNVIPPLASMVANIRLNPEDSIASAVEYVRQTINDPRIELSVSEAMEPSRISRTDCEGWKRVSTAVTETWKGCIAAPYLMVQCSDSRHYGVISDRVYRFSAIDLTAEELHSIHGNNEHIRLETICRAVEFYIRVMKQC